MPLHLKSYNGIMNEGPKKINIFTYSDYRKYLKDWYTQAKNSRASISYRSLSKRAGFKSVNFIKFVMEGKRNLTDESIAKLAIGLKLNKQETEFFRNLVYFTQATNHELKDRYYKDLLQSKKFNKLKPMDRKQYEFYSTWYHPVVRELVIADSYDGTIEWIARKINPKITEKQIEKSIALLEHLGFIKKNKNNKWVQSDSLVSSGDECASVTLMNYHKSLLALTSKQLTEIEPEGRDISALTLGVDKELIPEIKKRIQDFRKEILKLVSTENNPEEVVLFNMQFMPVTKTEKDEE